MGFRRSSKEQEFPIGASCRRYGWQASPCLDNPGMRRKPFCDMYPKFLEDDGRDALALTARCVLAVLQRCAHSELFAISADPLLVCFACAIIISCPSHNGSVAASMSNLPSQRVGCA